MNVAYALAVHVGHDSTANMAVIIENHMETSTKRLPLIPNQLQKISIEKGKLQLEM